MESIDKIETIPVAEGIAENKGNQEVVLVDLQPDIPLEPEIVVQDDENAPQGHFPLEADEERASIISNATTMDTINNNTVPCKCNPDVSQNLHAKLGARPKNVNIVNTITVDALDSEDDEGNSDSDADGDDSSDDDSTSSIIDHFKAMKVHNRPVKEEEDDDTSDDSDAELIKSFNNERPTGFLAKEQNDKMARFIDLKTRIVDQQARLDLLMVTPAMQDSEGNPFKDYEDKRKATLKIGQANLDKDRKQLDKLRTQLKLTRSRRSALRPRLKIPKDLKPGDPKRRVDPIDMKQIELYVGTCKPPNSTEKTSDKDNTIESCLRNLFAYGKNNGFAHKHYKAALGMILKGEYHREYMTRLDYKCSFEEIMDYFTDRYVHLETPQEALENLKTFKRDKGDKIKVTMAQYDLMLCKTKPLYKQSAWKSTKERFMSEALIQLVGKKTKESLIEFRENAQDLGVTLKYKQLLAEAERLERLKKEIPTETTKSIAEMDINYVSPLTPSSKADRALDARASRKAIHDKNRQRLRDAKLNAHRRMEEPKAKAQPSPDNKEPGILRVNPNVTFMDEATTRRNTKANGKTSTQQLSPFSKNPNSQITKYTKNMTSNKDDPMPLADSGKQSHASGFNNQQGSRKRTNFDRRDNRNKSPRPGFSKNFDMDKMQSNNFGKRQQYPTYNEEHPGFPNGNPRRGGGGYSHPIYGQQNRYAQHLQKGYPPRWQTGDFTTYGGIPDRPYETPGYYHTGPYSYTSGYRRSRSPSPRRDQGYYNKSYNPDLAPGRDASRSTQVETSSLPHVNVCIRCFKNDHDQWKCRTYMKTAGRNCTICHKGFHYPKVTTALKEVARYLCNGHFPKSTSKRRVSTSKRRVILQIFIKGFFISLKLQVFSLSSLIT